jgi:hypothetical protein
MPCIHCGLPTDGPENHGTIGECIDALVAETIRLRKAILETPKPGDIGSAAPERRDKKTDFAGS